MGTSWRKVYPLESILIYHFLNDFLLWLQIKIIKMNSMSICHQNNAMFGRSFILIIELDYLLSGLIQKLCEFLFSIKTPFNSIMHDSLMCNSHDQRYITVRYLVTNMARLSATERSCAEDKFINVDY